jgi:phosphopantetheinyl transferase
MPLYKEWKINEHALAAIWKIEEPESFFEEHTGMRPEIKNEKRRMERLAGRYLLQRLAADFPIHNINKDVHDKPRIDNDQYYFSISHSWPYVAAIIDTRNEAGIDIQTWHPRIGQIQHKFLSAAEQEIFQNDIKLLTTAWSAKEAVYKWNGRRGIDFIQHLPITFFSGESENTQMRINLNIAEIAQNILVQNFINIDFACSYVSITENALGGINITI